MQPPKPQMRAAQKPHTAAEMHHHLAFGQSVPALSVLVVDDHRGMQQILRTILHGLGVRQVRTVGSGAEALQALGEQAFCLALLDWQMPGADGGQLIRAIRQAHRYPACVMALAIVSGHATKAHVVEGLAAGAQQFIVKPVAPADLHKRLVWITHDDRMLIRTGDSYTIAGQGALLARLDGKPADHGSVSADDLAYIDHG